MSNTNLIAQISALATRAAGEDKTLHGLVATAQGTANTATTNLTTLTGKVGDLTALSTTAQGTIVAAINEVKSTAAGAVTSIGALINDSAAATTTVYSSSKVESFANAAAASAVNAIVAGAPAALDTLNELAQAIADDASFSSTVTTALGNRVRFDAAQTLTAGQLTQAQSNMNVYDKSAVDSAISAASSGLASAADLSALEGKIGTIDTSGSDDSFFVAVFNNALTGAQ